MSRTIRSARRLAVGRLTVGVFAALAALVIGTLAASTGGVPVPDVVVGPVVLLVYMIPYLVLEALVPAAVLDAVPEPVAFLAPMYLLALIVSALYRGAETLRRRGRRRPDA